MHLMKERPMSALITVTRHHWSNYKYRSHLISYRQQEVIFSHGSSLLNRIICLVKPNTGLATTVRNLWPMVPVAVCVTWRHNAHSSVSLGRQEMLDRFWHRVVYVIASPHKETLLQSTKRTCSHTHHTLAHFCLPKISCWHNTAQTNPASGWFLSQIWWQHPLLLLLWPQIAIKPMAKWRMAIVDMSGKLLCAWPCVPFSV